MVDLECRFYPLTEIHGITQKTRARDIKNLLTQWGYKYEWCDRKGVEILEKPTTALQAFTAMARQIVGINKQVDCEELAWFVILMFEDEEFSSMPWAIRAEAFTEKSGIKRDERTLRSWAHYLFKCEFLQKETNNMTVWCTKVAGLHNERVLIENPSEDHGYCSYMDDRKSYLKNLMNDGMPFKYAYKQTMAYLWCKYECVYYPCYQITANPFYESEILDLVQLAHECVCIKNQTSSEEIIV